VSIDRPTLSRKHFRIHAGAAPSVRDLGSANGTALNGVRLPPDADVPLTPGTLIEAGGLFFTLQSQDGPAPAPSPAVPAALPPAVVVEDPAMVRLHDLIGIVARSTMSVLVVGETGVGKEILAASVHQRSPRAAMPLVRINCAALPESLLESELFGYARGAFTGATQGKQGLLEAADGGTFFLDEIGEMPLSTQAKLLRVLESGEVTRLGSVKPTPIDVRFVAATNADLAALVAAGTFRRDLYYRLNGITIPVPPLRARSAEIASLARAFVAARAAASGRPVPAIAPEAIARLERFPWPGNVRQLRNVVDRALALCTGDVIRAEHVVLDAEPGAAPDPGRRDSPIPPPATLAPGMPAGPGRMRVDPEEDRRRLLAALEQAGGNQGRAAALLGISRRTLMKWLDDHQVPRPRKPRS
jgi:transcriptional regulator with PAS, ATPase and Fis domain